MPDTQHTEEPLLASNDDLSNDFQSTLTALSLHYALGGTAISLVLIVAVFVPPINQWYFALHNGFVNAFAEGYALGYAILLIPSGQTVDPDALLNTVLNSSPHAVILSFITSCLLLWWIFATLFYIYRTWFKFSILGEVHQIVSADSTYTAASGEQSGYVAKRNSLISEYIAGSSEIFGDLQTVVCRWNSSSDEFTLRSAYFGRPLRRRLFSTGALLLGAWLVLNWQIGHLS